MARIPVIQERQSVGRLRPVSQLSAPPSGAGAIGRGMQQVGQALDQVANTANQVVDRQAQLWATETSTSELTYWAQRSEELKSEAGEGGAGYFQALNKEYEQRANSILAQAPNDRSRQYLSQNFLSVRQRLLDNAIKFEVVEGRAALNNKFNEGADRIALVAAQTQDPVLTNDAIGQLKAQIDASNLTPSQKQQATSRLERGVSTAYASAVARDNPAAAVDILSQGLPTVNTKTEYTNLFAAIQTVESNNNPKAVSGAGAVGLMQVLPTTAMEPGFGLPSVFEFAKSKGVKFEGRTKESAEMLLKDEVIGAEYGQAYMKAMLDRYDGNVVYALAAYNWGPGRTDNWVEQGADMNALPEETRKYIPNVLNRTGLTRKTTGAPQDSLFDMLPLGEQLNLLNVAKENQSAQMVTNAASTVFREFGPQTDTDAIEIDVMNDHIDVIMAGNTLQERESAKTLVKEYANAHSASAKQRQAQRVSGVWDNVINGAPMSEIVGSPEWKALDGTQQKQLIGEINSFRTQPTSPAQWAAYTDITKDPAELAAMSNEEILSMSPMLGNQLTTQLLKDRAKLMSPEDIAEAKYTKDTFNVFASKAGLDVFDSRASPAQKEKIGQFKFAVDNAIVVRQNQLKRSLTQAETEEVMSEVLSNKVYVDELGRDPEVILSLVEEDDMGDTYVMVGTEQVYLREIPASNRSMIIRQLRQVGRPATEAAIAEVWLAAQQQPNPQFEQIPE